ncbi:hypothetical protein HY214_03620 [Candidatus Roizmanbacteria bacterium]|nr:hypothetical protein [Candidatus Roizmanbacteria bacterium]
MILVVCGGDTVASRQYFSKLKGDSESKGYFRKDLSLPELPEVLRGLGESRSLFGEKQMFFAENINPKVRRDSKTLLADLKKLHADPSVSVVVWEGVTGRDLKYAKCADIKEFRPSKTVFKFLDACRPGKISEFVGLLHDLTDTESAIFFLVMLFRHVRQLILAKYNLTSSSMPSWQAVKLKAQARDWKEDNLLLFYEALLRIEIGAKSGSVAYTIPDSLDILACHFLT